MNITPEILALSPDAKMAEANRWLEKAIQYEAEGKSLKIINMALDKACAIEKLALGVQ